MTRLDPVRGREPFLSAANVLLAESGCTIRKWRTGLTGVAYTHDDDWGIETPEPRGPGSFAVLAHEVGHQLMHRFNSDPRWLEEIEAWEFAIAQFERFELPGLERVYPDAKRSIEYALSKAERRSTRPTELVPRMLARRPAWAA